MVYYVATSLDGFISGPGDDVSKFLYEGEGVKKYQSDLADFDTVLMGRKTYEMGFQFGLEPGKNAYPGMTNYIFSSELHLENCEEGVHVSALDLDIIRGIRNRSQKGIYVCGGGKLAEWLLRHEQIDEIRIKVNPIILGAGIKLFENLGHAWQLRLASHETYPDGMMILSYEVLKPLS